MKKFIIDNKLYLIIIFLIIIGCFVIFIKINSNYVKTDNSEKKESVNLNSSDKLPEFIGKHWIEDEEHYPISLYFSYSGYISYHDVDGESTAYETCKWTDYDSGTNELKVRCDWYDEGIQNLKFKIVKYDGEILHIIFDGSDEVEKYILDEDYKEDVYSNNIENKFWVIMDDYNISESIRFSEDGQYGYYSDEDMVWADGFYDYTDGEDYIYLRTCTYEGEPQEFVDGECSSEEIEEREKYKLVSEKIKVIEITNNKLKIVHNGKTKTFELY